MYYNPSYQDNLTPQEFDDPTEVCRWLRHCAHQAPVHHLHRVQARARMAAQATSAERCGRTAGATGRGEQEAVAAATAAVGEQSKERRERLEQRARLPALLAELSLELGAPVEDAVSRSDSGDDAPPSIPSFSVAGGFPRTRAGSAATMSSCSGQ